MALILNILLGNRPSLVETLEPLFVVSLEDREKWNKKYDSPEHKVDRNPSEWLTKNSALLAGKGNAFDIAMGEGKNTVYLASMGYNTLGVDVAESAVRGALALAEEKKVRIEALVTDLDHYKFNENKFNLILCFNFLDRRLFPKIREALLPGGLLFFETFNIDHLRHSNFKKEWVLGHNELLKEFGDFRILRYQEVDRDEMAVTSLVAEK